MSRTYLDWARRNLAINGLARSRSTTCPRRLPGMAAQTRAPPADLIFLDPPTHSTSKRMQGALDIQRDHAALLQRAAAPLEPGGDRVLDNFQTFRLDPAIRGEIRGGGLVAGDAARGLRAQSAHPRVFPAASADGGR